MTEAADQAGAAVPATDAQQADRAIPVDPAWVARLFTRSDGSFRFARWGRPLAPVIVGVDDQGCQIFEQSIANIARIAGVEIRELDSELGANLMIYVVRDWAELAEAPNVIRLIPNLPDLIVALTAQAANQYRTFDFTEDGAIRLCIVLLRYDEALQRVSAQTLAVTQVFQALLQWSHRAFVQESPTALTEQGVCVIKPMHSHLLRAAYDPALPMVAADPVLALRLAARMTAMMAAGDIGGADAVPTADGAPDEPLKAER